MIVTDRLIAGPARHQPGPVVIAWMTAPTAGAISSKVPTRASSSSSTIRNTWIAPSRAWMMKLTQRPSGRTEDRSRNRSDPQRHLRELHLLVGQTVLAEH
jgi:hypothetical protein